MKTLRIFLLLLMFTTPSFTAIITNDLQLVSPVGYPLPVTPCHDPVLNNNSVQGITLHFLRTADGYMLIREHSLKGISLISLLQSQTDNANLCITLIPSSFSKDEKLTINMALE